MTLYSQAINTLTSSMDASFDAVSAATFILAAALVFSMALLSPLSSSKDKCTDVRPAHALITGGSQGLGKAVAERAVAEGMHVTILARGEDKLKDAVAELEMKRVHKEQVITFVSADVSNYASITAAVATATQSVGACPEIVFCCAGQAIPGFFLEQDAALYERGMKVNYLGAVNTAKTTALLMAKNNVKGRIVFVGSTLSLTGLVGYSQYSPTKFALRGLAECLRQELLPLGIRVQLYLAGTILSPGYDIENKTKPEITKKLEEGSSALTPEQCARSLWRGVFKNNFFITSDMDTTLVCAASAGLAPRNNMFVDAALGLAAFIAAPFVRRSQDATVKKNVTREMLLGTIHAASHADAAGSAAPAAPS